MSANQGFLTLNAPSIEQAVGIYLVPKVLANAQPWLVLEKFAMVTELPKNKGENIKWRRPVPFDVNTTTLVEGVTPPPDNFEMETIEDTIDQYGSYVNFSDKVSDLHEDPIAQNIVKELAKKAANTKELVSWNTVRAGTQVIYSGTATSRATVDTPLDLDQLRAAVALLKANHGDRLTTRIAASDGFSTEPVAASYVAVGSSYLDGDVKDCDGFVPVEKYGNANKLLSEYEVGKIEEMRVILTPELVPFYGAGAAIASLDVLSRDGVNVDVFALVCMAKEAWGITPLKGQNAMEVHLENPKMQRGDELGQLGFAAWKMYFCATRLNESWMVRIECAATDFAS
jgi:N4-gp56 family major capsid protein